MTEFTLDDVMRLLRECGGDAQETAEHDVSGTSFEDLGYDSLAVLELTARIEQEFAVVIPDDAVSTMATPQAAIDYVNARLTTATPDGR
jgi:minimal PKS acyl carrier protein